MKLRNKMTGEIIRVAEITVRTRCPENDEGDTLAYDDHGEYTSLANLNAEWEDYKPAEPLIKDEKVRKAVRVWAEANNINSNHYYQSDLKFNSSEHEFTWIDTSIQFNEITGLENLKHGKSYTIAELCGEEEE